MTDFIRPGEIINDTEGKRIHIHGGSILALDGDYYWYGEDKSQSTPETSRWHSGVRAHRSPDLMSWTDLGSILPAEPNDPDSPLYPAFSPLPCDHDGQAAYYVSPLHGEIRLLDESDA